MYRAHLRGGWKETSLLLASETLGGEGKGRDTDEKGKSFFSSRVEFFLFASVPSFRSPGSSRRIPSLRFAPPHTSQQQVISRMSWHVYLVVPSPLVASKQQRPLASAGQRLGIGRGRQTGNPKHVQENPSPAGAGLKPWTTGLSCKSISGDDAPGGERVDIASFCPRGPIPDASRPLVPGTAHSDSGTSAVGRDRPGLEAGSGEDGRIFFGVWTEALDDHDD